MKLTTKLLGTVAIMIAFSAVRGSAGTMFQNGDVVVTNSLTVTNALSVINGTVGIGTSPQADKLTILNSKSAAGNASSAAVTFAAPNLGPHISHVHWGSLGDWYIRSATNTGRVVLQDNGGNLEIGGKVFFGNGLRQMLNLYNSAYGIGVQDFTEYFRTDGSFAWYKGGTNHTAAGNAGGGSTVMTLGQNGFLTVNGLGNRRAYMGDDGVGADVQFGSLDSSVSDVYMWNAATACHMNLHVRTLIVAGGCDVVEPFKMAAQDIAKGSVVVIDDEHEGQLKLSDRAYDTRVAGIVSGANGINPGIALHQEGVLEGDQNVALSGRVYVLADATSGSITPGDLLTTSTTPGHAMRVTDRARASGAILGKAMSELKDGKGMVLVLVSLQ